MRASSKILGIIPAREGSVRVRGKNKRILGGKPLISHVIDQAIKSNELSVLCVSSDDKTILNIASRYKNIRVIKRPKSISTQKSQAYEYVIHALKELNEEFTHFCIIPPTSPFTNSQDIDGTIRLALKKNCESAVSVTKIDHSIHPYKLKKFKGTKLEPFFEEENGRMAEHELPKIYVRNCSVYVSKVEVLQEYKQILGKDMHGYLMPPERSIDINEERDFLFAEYMYEMKRTNKKTESF